MIYCRFVSTQFHSVCLLETHWCVCHDGNRTTLKTRRQMEMRRMALSQAQICRLHPGSTGTDEPLYVYISEDPVHFETPFTLRSVLWAASPNTCDYAWRAAIAGHRQLELMRICARASAERQPPWPQVSVAQDWGHHMQ